MTFHDGEFVVPGGVSPANPVGHGLEAVRVGRADLRLCSCSQERLEPDNSQLTRRDGVSRDAHSAYRIYCRKIGERWYVTCGGVIRNHYAHGHIAVQHAFEIADALRHQEVAA